MWKNSRFSRLKKKDLKDGWLCTCDKCNEEEEEKS